MNLELRSRFGTRGVLPQHPFLLKGKGMSQKGHGQLEFGGVRYQNSTSSLLLNQHFLFWVGREEHRHMFVD